MSEPEAKIIGNYQGTSVAKINPSGTQIIITSYIDISQVSEFTPAWLQAVYGSLSYTTIYQPPEGFTPDLPKRGAPRKKQNNNSG